MKKTLKYIIAPLLLLALGFTSCYDDKGNYDYTDLIYLEIDTTGISPEMIVKQQSLLTIKPTIDYKGNKADLDYTWIMYEQNPVYNDETRKYPDPIQLSKEEALSYKLDIPANKYIVRLTVKDKTNDTDKIMTWKVQVESVFSRGWMVLAEKDGLYDVDLIKTTMLIPDLEPAVDEILSGIYSIANQEKVKDGRLLIQQKGKVYVYSDNAGVVLNNVTFNKELDYTEIFTILDKGSLPRAMGVSFNSAQYIINGTDLHVYSFGKYSPPLLGDYEAAPFLLELKKITGVSGPNAVIYDMKHKRFMQLPLFGSQLGGYENPVGADPLFDMNNIGMKIVHMENGYSGYGYNIFEKEDTHEFFLYVIDFNNFVQSPVLKQKMDQCPDIAKANTFAFGTRGEVCYYGADNKVYLYDYRNSNMASTDKGIIFEDDKEKIVSMKVYKDPARINLDCKVLVVATWNDVAKAGKVYMYNVNEHTGDIDKDSVKMFPGFGRIVDMCFKNN